MMMPSTVTPAVLFAALFVALLLLDSSVVEAASKKKKILSFGGNGQIGSETLHRLHESYDITLVSRGSWPFDAENRIAPFVKNIECDREEGLDDCEELMQEIEATTEPYFAVLDFSAYFPDWVDEALHVLKDNKPRVYIYISTDSVYEVTEVGPYKDTGRKLKETDAVRPDNEELEQELNELDEYGDQKLQGEEVLREHRADDEGIPFVSLRFADVVGPRDNTERFVRYYSWIKFQHLKSVPPIAVNDAMLEASSITYVNDAAQSIIAAMDEANTTTGTLWDEAYNIACEEVFNVTSAITMLGEIMGQRGIMPLKVKDFDVRVYPSVTKGPMDITKAKQKLGFTPTRLRTALEETVAFYDELYAESYDFREEVIDALVDILDEVNDFESKEEREAALEELIDELPDSSDMDEL